MSSIWKHFTHVTDSVAECNYCKREYNVKKTTASLKYHLNCKHSDKLEPVNLSDETSDLW